MASTYLKHNPISIDLVVGKHPKMAHIFKLIEQVANSDATILIQGESGTGKELIARNIHVKSSRRDHQFIPINCSALSENLLESELFGHKKGAFTDAVREKIGWFAKAEKGTIFLDEISEISLKLQVKLLRILQSGEYSPVGGTEILKCNLRVIAATNQMLNLLIKEGKFREDLFYRLNVIHLKIPPLRERKTDIPLLIDYFLGVFNSMSGYLEKELSKEAKTILLDYDYPGNIRELENAIHHAVIVAEDRMIKPENLPEIFLKDLTQIKINNGNSLKPVEKAEQEFIIFCLEKADGKVCHAAEIAGIDVSQFYRSVKKYSINLQDFRL